MKDLINKPSSYFKIEFWAATTIFVFLVFFQISNALTGYQHSPEIVRAPFDFRFVSNLIRYVVLYSAFILLSFRIVPMLVRRESIVLNSISVLIVFLLIGIVFGTTNTYLKYLLTGQSETAATNNFIFQNSLLYALWLMLVFGFYCVLKYFGLYLLSNYERLHDRYKFITPEGLAAFSLWMMSMFILLVARAEGPVVATWAVFVPSAILFYWYSFHSLIPKSLAKKKPFRNYAVRSFVAVLVAYLPSLLLCMIIAQDEEVGTVLSLFNVLFLLFIVAPLSWIMFKRKMKGNEEIFALKTELGRSTANFDFLRSQINPHFLFNALNTIYGTAIQEKAERTSEGIERLGDMMRFMLQENMQGKISLSREIDYLNNYISLQKLRTDPNPIVRIDAEIDKQVHPIQIAPMLLIPFVENAFKHGISLREPSHIKINLEVNNNVIYFDVYNTKHEKPENDPEKNKSGIGLNNVKQRLQLLYTSKHELIIRETKKDFFVHLTMHLS